MKKTVKKIAEALDEILERYSIDEATALKILALAAGGEDNVADYLDDEEDACDCDCKCKDDEDYDEDDDEEVLANELATVGSGARLTIPSSIIREAENINGSLTSVRNGNVLTVVRYGDRIELYFGDLVEDFDDDEDAIRVNLIHATACGQVSFTARPTFEADDSVEVFLYEDGKIVIE